MSYFDFITPLNRLTLARAEALNALFAQIANGFEKLPGAARLKQNKVTFGENEGTANALVVTLPDPPDAYEAGFEVRVRVQDANTGSVTVNVNGLGIRQVRSYFNAQLLAGDIQANMTAVMIFDGSHFRLLSATPVAPTDEQIQSAVAQITIPVQSVQGKTGEVTLSPDDISAPPKARQIGTGDGLTGGGDLSQNRTLALNGLALAFHQLGQNGFAARTGAGSAVSRVLQGGQGITITNPSGEGGNPQISMSVPFVLPALSGGASVDLSTGNYFTVSVDGNLTFTFANAPSGAFGFTLEINHVSGAITWPGSVEWPFGFAPILTPGNVHLIGFLTSDGGTTWRGAALVDYGG